MKYGGKAGLLFMLISVVTLSGSVISAEGGAGNMLYNGDFSRGSQGWELVLCQGGEATMEAKDEVLSLDVVNQGDRFWSVQLLEHGLRLDKDEEYEISFEARSRGIEHFNVRVNMTPPPYTAYSGERWFTLSKEFKRYSFRFTMRTATDRNATFLVQMGRVGTGGMDISKIKVTHVGRKPAETVSRDFPKPAASRIMRGITFGNTLDAPYEGAWGPEVKECYFDLIRQCGIFDHIRIPVRWDTHAMRQSPYTIEPEFMRRVDWAVSQSLHRGLYVVLNMHYFDALAEDPPSSEDEFIALWKQIADYYKNYPDNLYFEIYNEPQRGLDKYWNEYYPKVYDEIRKTNPTRKIVISSPHYATIAAIDELVLPKRIRNDPNIIVQFHFYVPVEFCFQGSPGNGFEDVHGRRWTGTDEQKKELARLADNAVAWAKRNGGVRLWNGEFCAQAEESKEEDRRLWTAYVVKLCEERDIAWAYWEFANCSTRIYDPITARWDPMLEVLKGK